MDKPILQLSVFPKLMRLACSSALLFALASCANPIEQEMKRDPSGKTAPNTSEPIISAVSNVTITQDTSATIPFTIADVDGPLSCQTSVFVSNSNTSLLPAMSMVKQGSYPNCQLKLTPSPGYWGSTTVKIEVNDGSTSAYSNFTLSVTEGNPVATVSNVSVNEGSNAVFTVTLTQASPLSKTVSYQTIDGTAIAGVHYTATTGSITFAPGQTTRTVSVPTIHDNINGPNRTFTLSATAVGITSQGTGTVVNTDAAPTATAANVTANEGSTLTFTVNLNRASTSATTVTYATSNASAVAGTNYTAASGSLSFAAGETSKTVSVNSIDDGIFTGNLAFNLALTANSVTNNATGTITNTNGAPTASASDISANEGSNLVFTVNLNRASASSTAVTYATANGTATAGTNYTSTSGTLTFAAGETSKTLTVPSIIDGVFTADLTFSLGLTANSVTNTATGTVQNTDGAPTASAANVSANEGSNLVFTVNLNHPSASATSVSFATADGTAAAGTKYISTTGTLNFAAGETAKTVTVPSTADGIYTANLAFTLSLTANSITNTATGTIVNTDALPTASASAVSANEGSNLVFTVTLNRASASTTTITYATSNGTAASGTNYTSTSGTLTFAAGETSKTVTVPSLADGIYAANLTFNLSLTANSVTNNAVGTVVNTDAAPTATAANVSANEGSNLAFTVTLNRASTTSTSVAYATVGNTALAGTNYTATSGTLTFTAGQTSKTVTVASLADGAYTADLDFNLNVTANAVTNTATGTIVNTDGAPTASASNVSANEGSNLSFTVNLNRPSASATTVTYSTADGTAAAGTNYTSTSGTLTFAAGETSKTVTVPSASDGIYTTDLTFTLSLTANSVTSSATGTVVNTDAAPTASASAVSGNEGSNLVFAVSLTRASAAATTVTYATSNGTATAGTNYTSTSGTLTFAAGETSKSVTVPSLADGIYAANLAFTLSLTANSVTNTAMGTVVNTDAAPIATSANVSANEGSNLVFTVTLNRASTTSTSVTFATTDGTGVAGTNYTSTSGTLTFTAGQTSKTVTVPSLADGVYAANLTFTLSLTANSVTNTATGTVTNTDGAPTASASNVSANEGSDLAFTVNLNRAATSSTTVTYATSDGTAAAGTNYTSASGTLTFAAGETSKSVTVSSLSDGVYAANLTFMLSLTANSVTNTATGTVTNTDAAPTATASAVSANEGSNLVFTVALNRASTTSTTVTYATSNGTATSGTNYTSTSGTLNFTAGQTSKTVTVPSLNDGIYAADLAFTLSLTANSVTNTSTGTALNTDTAPTASANNVSANEGTNLSFTVILNHASTTSTTVTYATSDGTGVAGTNYTSTSGTLTFTAGQTSKTVTVPTLSDGIYSADVTTTLSITANSTTNTATGTITNTDAAPIASAANAAANEGADLIFTVNLNRASSTSTSVAYATSNGTASAGTNYTATSGTLTFAAGETSKTVTVASLDDGLYTANLAFTLSLTANSTANTATGTVNNTNGAPTASAANVSANEGSVLTFTVILNRASSTSTTVNYATVGNTAIAGTNYTATSGTLTYAAGETSKTVTVASLNDGVYTPDLNFTFNVTANSVTNSGSGTVVNTNAAPTASAVNITANEGSNLIFTVNLSRASSTSTSVTYATTDGTATAGVNYTSTSGTLTFAAGETSKTITVPSLDDGTYTANLGFTLGLTASSTTNTASGTIVNTQSAPTASASNVSANEGSNVTFTVALNHPSSTSTTVTYATTDGTAAAGTNYTSTSGTLTFAAGETSKTVSVPTASDSIYAANLTFTLSMTANSTANTATGTVVNTDAAPTASAANVSATEGSNLTFTVTLNRASTTSTTVSYATVGNTAFAGTNYVATSGSLVFTAGQTSKTVTVVSLSDGVYTPNLTFNLNLTANSVTNSAVGTVANTDTAPTATTSNVTANEGSNLTFTVSLNRSSSTSTSVTYATSDGSALSGTNYTSTSGTLTFAAGETSKTVSVPSLADGVYTGNLAFTFSVTANSTTNTASGTITNTDTAPTASASNVTANEGSNLAFTVTLNRSSSSSTSVSYSTGGGSAVAGTNYTSASGTLTFAAGETTKTVTVSSLNDGVYTGNLTFTLSMTANSTTNTATGTITNTDTAPTATAANASASEGSNITFTVTLNRASSSTTSVTYATSDGTAAASVNYTAKSGTLTFAAGETSKTVAVTTLNDATYSSSLTFTFSITANSTTNTATGTIVNTDSVPSVSLSAASSSVTEGNNAGFTIALDHASTSAVTVNYATASGTATSGSDFTSTSGTATITAGALSTTVNVPTIDDNADEQDEAFTMSISSPANATLGTSSAAVTIQDTALYFNFLAGSLPSGVTFSRSSSGSYYDSSGIIQTAASGTPRFDYNPSACAGTCNLRGLLVEESRTNLLLQSAAFGSTWTTSNATVTSNTDLSPAGTTTADEIGNNSIGSNSDRVVQAVTLAASTRYTVSFFVKNSNATVSRFEVSASNSGNTGKISNITWSGAVPSLSAGTVTALPDNWYRVQISFTTNASDAGSANVNFYPSTSSGLSNKQVLLWGAQLEAGSTATSYIATGASTVTRAADGIAVNNFSNWFNATAWTAILDFSRSEYETSVSTATPTLFSACDDTSGATCATDYIESKYLPSDNTFRGRSFVASSQSATSNYTNAANLTGVTVQAGLSLSSGGEVQTAINGTAATKSSTASVPTVYSFAIGSGGKSGAFTKQLNGHVKKFTYRARALTAAQMQAMTSD